MHRLRTPSILGAAIAGLLVLTSGPALARITIAVAPALLELEGSPGSAGRIALTVSDNGDEPIDVVTGITELTGMVGDHSAVAWSRVTPERTSLQPGEHRTIEYIVEIPDDAPSGGRYAAITITTAPPQASPSPSASAGADTSSHMTGRIEVPVFLTVDNGTDGLVGRPITIERSALFLGQDGSLAVVTDVSNGGNVHVPLTGHARLTDASRSPGPSPSPSPLADIHFTMGRLLPETTRTYVADDLVTLPLDSPYDLTIELGPPEATDATVMRAAIAHATEHVVATPSMSVGSIDVCRAVDGSYQVSVALVNDGDLGLVPAVTLGILDVNGTEVGNARASVQAASWPGTTVDATGVLAPDLPDGTWTLIARVAYGPDLATESSRSLTIGTSTDAPLACPAPMPSSSVQPSPSAAASPDASPVG
jgi:hypothetical protein